MLKAQDGHVPAAIYKEGIGDIDFVWGTPGRENTMEGCGLAHIKRRREEEGSDAYEVIKAIPNIIKYGVVSEDKKHVNMGSGQRKWIEHSKYRLVIDESGGNNWVLTAMITGKKKKP